MSPYYVLIYDFGTCTVPTKVLHPSNITKQIKTKCNEKIKNTMI